MGEKGKNLLRKKRRNTYATLRAGNGNTKFDFKITRVC